MNDKESTKKEKEKRVEQQYPRGCLANFFFIKGRDVALAVLSITWQTSS